MAVVERERIPGAWEPRVHPQLARFEPHAEQRLDDQSVHPPGRARVPGPAAATRVRTHGVNVGRDDVRLHPVALHLLHVRRVADRVEERKELPRPLGVAQLCERHDGPDGPVGVLTAVLAHAGHVPLDVAGLRARIGRTAERKAESTADSRRTSRWSTPSMARRARAGSAAPDSTAQLWARESIWHSSFAAEPKRRAVVEVRASVPFPVPCVPLDVLLQLRRFAGALPAELAIPPALRQFREALQHVVQEERQPYALALASVARRGSCRHSSRRCPSGASPCAPKRSPRVMARTQCS